MADNYMYEQADPFTRWLMDNAGSAASTGLSLAGPLMGAIPGLRPLAPVAGAVKDALNPKPAPTPYDESQRLSRRPGATTPTAPAKPLFPYSYGGYQDWMRQKEAPTETATGPALPGLPPTVSDYFTGTDARGIRQDARKDAAAIQRDTNRQLAFLRKQRQALKSRYDLAETPAEKRQLADALAEIDRQGTQAVASVQASYQGSIDAGVLASQQIGAEASKRGQEILDLYGAGQAQVAANNAAATNVSGSAAAMGAGAQPIEGVAVNATAGEMGVSGADAVSSLNNMASAAQMVQESENRMMGRESEAQQQAARNMAASMAYDTKQTHASQVNERVGAEKAAYFSALDRLLETGYVTKAEAAAKKREVNSNARAAIRQGKKDDAALRAQLGASDAQTLYQHGLTTAGIMNDWNLAQQELGGKAGASTPDAPVLAKAAKAKGFDLVNPTDGRTQTFSPQTMQVALTSLAWKLAGKTGAARVQAANEWMEDTFGNLKGQALTKMGLTPAEIGLV